MKENPFADKGTIVFTLEKVVHSIGSLKKMLELQFGYNLVRIDGEVMATTEKPFKNAINLVKIELSSTRNRARPST